MLRASRPKREGWSFKKKGRSLSQHWQVHYFSWCSCPCLMNRCHSSGLIWRGGAKCRGRKYNKWGGVARCWAWGAWFGARGGARVCDLWHHSCLQNLQSRSGATLHCQWASTGSQQWLADYLVNRKCVFRAAGRKSTIRFFCLWKTVSNMSPRCSQLSIKTGSIHFHTRPSVHHTYTCPLYLSTTPPSASNHANMFSGCCCCRVLKAISQINWSNWRKTLPSWTP